MLKFTALVLKGFVLGVSMAIPGLSAGTMAFIMGIYQKLISEISKFKINPIKNLLFSFNKIKNQQKWQLLKEGWDWRFLLPLFLGLVIAITTFTFFAIPLIEKHSLAFYSLIFGLILASLFKPFKEMKKTTQTFLWLGLSFLINIWIFTWKSPLTFSFDQLGAFIFLPAGLLVSTALIIPGISGSYILLLLNLYEKTFISLREGDILIISLFLMGAIKGIFLTARGVNYLIKQHFHVSMAVILGLILASLYVIYPLPKESLEDILSFDSSKQIFLWYAMSGLVIFWLFSFLAGKIKNLKF